MVTLILNFLREQGILIVMGWMLAGGIFRQVMEGRRYRRLRAGIQSLQGGTQAAPQSVTAGMSQGAMAAVDPTGRQGMTDKKEAARKRRARRDALEYGQAEATRLEPLQKMEVSQRGEIPHKNAGEPIHTPSQDPELDSQLLYLKQSLDRIAAGRDQKLEEEAREHRKLTPEQEAIIADILREYLS